VLGRRPTSWFSPGSGPLVRPSDRLERCVRVLFALSLFAVIPIALAVATAAHAQVRAVASAEAEDRQQVTVTLLDDVPARMDEEWDNPPNEQATAVWTDPSGIEHQVPVDVPPGSRAGSTLSVWVDGEGNRTTRPLTDGDVAAEAVGMGVLTLSGLSLVALGAYRWACALLDRSRSRRWAAEWAIVEPVWTRKVP
jgi:hypothetical protein